MGSGKKKVGIYNIFFNCWNLENARDFRKAFAKAHIISELLKILKAERYLLDKVNIKLINRHYLFTISKYFNF